MWLLLAPAFAAPVFPEKPPANTWIVDPRDLISPEDEAAIDAICFALWKDERIPMYVVTIRSLADNRAGGIEPYAAALFDEWGIGSEDRDVGILLLVAEKDRKARIELGKGWAHAHDADATALMDEQIVPRFRRDESSQAILAGVRGLDAMARGLDLPSPYYPPEVVAAWAGGGILGLGIGVSLIRSGRSGWGWGVLAFALGVLAWLAMRAGKTRRDHHDSSSGFGGGSSGGGGATGSW